MSATTCPNCGSPLPDDARFCPRCGAPIEDRAPGEHRFLTVLFADLSRSTELANRLDPDRYGEVLAAFYAAAEEIVTSLRGRVEKLIGDAAMAVFGLPQASEDDALRAVRAAISIRDRVGRLSEELGLDAPLQVHSGLNSGPVAIGSRTRQSLLLSGATINLAARLQEAAEPGEILAGETTRQLVRDAVELGDPREIEARGFDGPTPAHPIASLSPRSSRRTIPLAGRRRELALLLDSFERVREAPRAALVTVLGEPGIGKTRLVEELVAAAPEGTRVLSGRAGADEDESPFAPVTQIIRRVLEVGPDAAPDLLHKRLDEVVQGCCEPSEAEATAARLALALGLGEEPHGGHRYRLAEVRAGFETLVRGLATEGPVLLVFDDLHLARPDLLELIEDVVRRARGAAILVVVLAREGLLETKPGWAGGIRDALTIHLEPLSEEVASLLARYAGGELDEPTARRIARLAGGNPLFIIETTGMLMERPPVPEQAEPLIPPTVQAISASRLDQLPEAARELARRASIFHGGRFDEEDLALVARPDPEVLRRLEEAELLVRDPDGWRFRHRLLREVAYESLAKRDRIRLHLQVADGLERSRPERRTGAAAHHLERAATASGDLGDADPALSDRAIAALARAADEARRRIESRTACDLYERALGLAGPEQLWGQREARILAGIGEARYWLGEFEEAETMLAWALDLGADDPWTRTLAARFLGDVVLNVRGDPERAGQLFDDALEAAKDLGDPWATARTLLMAGWAPYWRDDLDGARAMFEGALEAARANPEGDPWTESRALGFLSDINSPAGDEAESHELALASLEVARGTGDPFTIGVAQQSVGNSLRRMNRLDEALTHIESAAGAFRDLGARWELAATLGDRGFVHRLAGRFPEAEADLREALDLCKELGDRALVAWTTAQLAGVQVDLGRAAAARATLREEAAWERPSEPGSDADLLLAEALVARAEGDREGALDLARRALARELARDLPNQRARAVWIVGSVFGPDAAGGERAVEDARRTLKRHRWAHPFREAELIAAQPPADPSHS